MNFDRYAYNMVKNPAVYESFNSPTTYSGSSFTNDSQEKEYTSTSLQQFKPQLVEHLETIISFFPQEGRAIDQILASKLGPRVDKSCT